jgi:hypothetical protein
MGELLERYSGTTFALVPDDLDPEHLPQPEDLVQMAFAAGAETDGSGSYVFGPMPVTNRMPVSGGSWTLCDTVHAVPGAPACA